MTTITPELFSPQWDRLRLAVNAATSGVPAPLDGLTVTHWADFLDICNQHWMSPFIYRMLLRERRTDVPASIRRGFRKSYLLSGVRARLAGDRLVPVLKRLGEAEIPVIALKGTHLATQVYADPAMRPMADADLLIRRSDLDAAVRIIESFGYRQAVNHRHSGGSGHNRISREASHLPPFRNAHGQSIELHHDLEAPLLLPGLATDGLWDRARPARIGEADVLVLSPEDALLHLCVHAAFHHLFGVKLLSLCDIPTALNRWRDGLDWPLFWRLARDWGAERSAALTLAWTGFRMGYPLPEGALHQLTPVGGDTWEELLDIAERQMRARAILLARRRSRIEAAVRQGKRFVHPDAAEGQMIRLWLLPTWKERLLFAVSRMFPSKEELLADFGLSSRLFPYPLLYPVRLALLVFRRLPWLLSILTGRTARRPLSRAETLSSELAKEKLRLASWLAGKA